MLETNDANFDADVVKNEIPVIVDFYADWCGPCRGLASTLLVVEHYFKDRVKFVKVDVDSNNEVSNKYGVRGLPTIHLFKDGMIIGTRVGAVSQKDLMNWLESNIA